MQPNGGRVARAQAGRSPLRTIPLAAPETPQPTEGQGDALEVREAEFEVVNETPFFAPVASDILDSLLV